MSSSTASRTGPTSGGDSPSPSARPRRRAASRTGVEKELRLVSGGAGDHPSVHGFLLGVLQSPSAAEFQAQVEDPFYEPSDRLLIWRGSHIIAHVRLTKREMHFGSVTLPIAELADLAVSPEYRGRGCAAALLAAADRQMARDKAVLGLLRTTIPAFFRRIDWAVCMGRGHSTAGPRAILSHLSALKSLRASNLSAKICGRVGKPLNIRLWRHVEQAALMRLYAENIASAFGPLRRSEAYWRWLIGRRGYDRIYVAIDGPDKLQLDEALTPIVGYAATREGRIVEMMTSPRRGDAGAQLLARACRDAIERGFHPVRLESRPGDRLHDLLVKAGGEHRCGDNDSGEVCMVKICDPSALLTALGPELNRRAQKAGLAGACELGLLIGREKHRLTLSNGSVSVAPGKLGRSYLACTRDELTQLLVGHIDVREAVNAGRVSASTQLAVATAAALFPRLPIWRPPLDELPA